MAEAGKVHIGQQRKDRAYRDASRAIRKLRKHGGPINFNSVAAEAHVSRQYLSDHPEFGPLIRKLRPQTRAAEPPRAVVDDTGIVAVLRAKINTQTDEISALNQELHDLRRQLEIARGTIVTLRQQQTH